MNYLRRHAKIVNYGTFFVDFVYLYIVQKNQYAMKKILLTTIIIGATMSILGFSNFFGKGPNQNDDGYTKLWKEIDKAENKDLPKTVVELCDKIIQKAINEENKGQFLKAYFYRADYVIALTPDSLYSRIKDLEKMAAECKEPVQKMALHSTIASIYSEYARNNSWQLNRRTNVAGGEKSSNVDEWGSQKFISTILENIESSLADYSALANYSNEKYKPFVIQNYDGAYYNHDMLHIISNAAIRSIHNIGHIAVDKKQLQNKIEEIHQKAAATYKDAGNRNGYILKSLDYIDSRYFGKHTNLYINKVNELIEENKESEASVEAYLKLLQLNDSYIPASKKLEYCNMLLEKFPKAKRTSAIKSVKERILKPVVSISLPTFAYPNKKESLTLQHVNSDNVEITLYKLNDATIEELKKRRLEEGDLKKCTIVYTKKIELQRPADYKLTSQKVEFDMPGPGVYTYKMSTDDRNIYNGDVMRVGRMRVLSTSYLAGKGEVVVVDRLSGAPLNGVELNVSYRYRDDKNYVKVKNLTAQTDKDGKAVIQIPKEEINRSYDYRVKPTLGDDRYMDDVGISIVSRNANLSHEFSVYLKLFTDRSIYRPGQTVYLKGILYSQEGDNLQALENESITLELYDANRQKVGDATLKSNKFGSINTSFTLPTSGLNGVYTISSRRYNTSTTIRVEEYKRPSFEVNAEQIDGMFKIGDTVDVTALAKSFSGVPLDGAEVKYTISRTKLVGWREYTNELLEEGTTTTDQEGKIKIPVELTAPEDELADELKEKEIAAEENDNDGTTHYRYFINIEVTNLAGETQSAATTIYAGEKSLNLRFGLLNSKKSGYVDKDGVIKCRFSVTNLAYKDIDTQVDYKLYSLNDKGEKDKLVKSGTVRSNKDNEFKDWKNIANGKYRLEYSAKDKDGNVCDGCSYITFFSKSDTKPLEGTTWWSYRDGDEIYFGSSENDATIFVDTYAAGEKISSEVIKLSNKVLKKNFVYRSEYGDGANIRLFMVRNDQFYQSSFEVQRPKPDNDLKMSWVVFRDKLIPGQKEEWRLTILTPDGKPADAELLAYMYDASLNKIASHPFYTYIGFNRNYIRPNWSTANYSNRTIQYNPIKNVYISSLDFDTFISLPNLLSTRYYSRVNYSRSLERGVVESKAVAGAVLMDEEVAESAYADNDNESADKVAAMQDSSGSNEGPQIRSNFNETAFFLPELRTDAAGNVAIAFTLPESLTKWEFRALAHNEKMNLGTTVKEIVAQKDFMIAPNMPRFVRVSDKTNIASTLSNLTDKSIQTSVTFELFDPATEKVFAKQQKSVAVEAKRSKSVAFEFEVPEKYDVIGVRIVANGGKFSDGEQHLLPVLSDKIRLVESVAMPIRGEQTKEFSLATLFNHHSHSATRKSLTIEFTGNPAWYAVQALPSLAEPDDDCAICWTNALYANAVATHIANSNPKIKNVFESWKKSGQNKETLLSNLQKNEELKTILLNESPWVMEAKSELEQKERISTLFDVMNMANTNSKALKKLQELQLGEGGWSWFKGMIASPWITEYVLTQNIRVQLLTGKPLTKDIANMHDKGLNFMHKEIKEVYDEIMKEKARNRAKGVSYFVLRYLYLVALEAEARSFSEGKSVRPIDLIPSKYTTPYNYFLNKVNEVPRSQDMQEKAMAAIVLQANGKDKAAAEYMQSLKEHLTSSEELGMYFAFNENPYRWGSLNLNAQIAAIEAFDKVAKDTKTVEEMKIWLLKQKQTQMWKTTPLTADAVYALLARGDDWLSSEGEVTLTFANREISTIKPDEEGNAPVPGLNYIKRNYSDEATVDTRSVKVEKKDKGIAWGAAYATFFEKLSNVKDNGSKEMSITKELYVKRVGNISATGGKALTQQLESIKDGAVIKVGDIVTARMVIKIDRTMEFVQLKEQRGACFEPMTQISGYKWGSGAGYYEEIKDASTNFFFYSLGKGTYVLEVNYRASRSGKYEVGLATLQCAYAPEFCAHSSSMRIKIQE